jgi:ParB family chromosome partitioning protein
METNKTKNTDLFLIDPRNIVVVDGFNVRRDFDLDELKEQIKAKGVLNPLTVIAFKDDEGNEKYKLVDGERRYRATMLAISEGADIPYVRAMKARKDASTEELYIQQMMRNEGKKFTEYECAIMFRRFKEEFGYSQVEIADKFKKSPAFISKCLSLLDLPPYIQERIMKGELSVKAAKEIAANYGSEKEQVKAAKSAVDNAKENGRATATNKEVLNSLKDSKEAKAIAEALRKVWAYLDGEVIVDVDKLARLLDKTESLSQAMREYKKGGHKMKLRKEKEQIPADFRKQMYENYKANMTLYGKPILPYKQWLKDVFNTKLPCCGK